MIRPTDDQKRYELSSPTLLPKASGFLWNEKMMIHMNCRGYAVAQFMQPEPAKYSHAPNLEAKTFMQPEQPYYAHHPGRFVYVKDEENGAVFSAPYEPVRVQPEQYLFSVGKHDIRWEVQHQGLRVVTTLSLPKEDALELWRVKVKNMSQEQRKISLYPYFTIGYMSWMNQSGEYREELQAIVASSVTPYQKYQDYDKIKHFSDKTFLLAEHKPDAWEVNQEAFEGEGGIMMPSAIQAETLAGGEARYETPAAVLQYRLELAPGEEREFRFVFGPAHDEAEVAEIRRKYYSGKNNQGEDGFVQAEREYADYISEGKGTIEIQTPDADLDNFVNHWLPRQLYYHGITNRLTTDPQTRNYLQDNMGMSYIKPETARAAFLTALSQQEASGAMPDGIILHKDAELKYINQVPHTDHCVWLPICLSTYLDETGDYTILDEQVPFGDSSEAVTVLEHIHRAMQWLIKDRDERGLNFINQGDWCDPMNMVGYKGKGVSGWLTIATAYAFLVWSDICEHSGHPDAAKQYRLAADETNAIVNEYLWDGDWYARGITDDGVVFGISTDKEGRIFINPQGWALLSGAADDIKQQKLMRAVEEQLETPYGVEKLAPSYTSMREDVGRVTQKHPGSAENGAVYNHAAAFYIYGLYAVGEQDNAYRLLRKMLPGPDREDILRRGQLPVFIPNYYRGAYRQFPKTAGRSSHLFNTGTVPWVYRCLVDGLFGVQGTKEGLRIQPQLPSDWQEATVKRTFRGAGLHIEMKREAGVTATEVYVNGNLAVDGVAKDLQPGAEYQVLVKLPQ
ncbi:GH36-type glycosyl hydrolase domain-containing protein [Paenibacillus physcomitrellae]|uniref:Cellobionic acid phosphorylase n=1 Tax=Paenibacillus physcomitrellae TaxID=1619311 RepID=A0ABQ1GSQ6_9BACL|nr:NdvB protein [Paenibacillus physcomitrellae]GGA48906.1 cellobionic acid phosphorylase [Paenibacillus physcomitrellae]